MGIVNAGSMPIYDDIPSDLLKLCTDAILNIQSGDVESINIYNFRFCYG